MVRSIRAEPVLPMGNRSDRRILLADPSHGVRTHTKIGSTIMDFLTECQPTAPPPFTFDMPRYCPPVNVPVASSPRVIWRPPPPPSTPPPSAPQGGSNPPPPPPPHAPRTVWKGPPPALEKVVESAANLAEGEDAESIANGPRVIWKPPPPTVYPPGFKRRN